MAGIAPDALNHLPEPDAIFIGDGLITPDLLETCLTTLRPGSILTANRVIVESEQILFQWQGKLGVNLTCIAIQRAEPGCKFLGWKAMAFVTRWAVVKG